MEWAQLPIVQLGAIGVLLAVLWMVFRGGLVPHTLVPRTTLEDVRADRDARVAQAISDRDDRVKEANEDADQWRHLYVSECAAHELTRQAYAVEVRSALLASTEAAQVAASLLREIKLRQIEAGP